MLCCFSSNWFWFTRQNLTICQFSNSVHCDFNSRLNAAKTSATMSDWFTITASASHDTIVSTFQLYLKYCTQRNHHRSCWIEIIILCYDYTRRHRSIDRAPRLGKTTYTQHSTHWTANSPPNSHCLCCCCYCFVRRLIERQQLGKKVSQYQSLLRSILS